MRAETSIALTFDPSHDHGRYNATRPREQRRPRTTDRMTKEEATIAEPAADAEPVEDAQPTNPTEGAAEGAAEGASNPTDAAAEGAAAAAKAADGDAVANADEDSEVAINPVKLGPVTFNSGDEMMLWFSHLRAENTLNQNLNDYEAAVVEACIRQGHDKPDSKLGCGVRCIQVRMHPMYRVRTYMVIRTDATMEDFSYRKCVAKLFPGYDPSTFSNSALATKGVDKWNEIRYGGRDGGRGGRGGGRGGRGGRFGGRVGGGRGGGRGRGRGGPDRGGDRFGGGGRGGGRGGRGRGAGDKPRFGRPY